MSTDYDIVCDKCKLCRHLGQSMGATHSFGFGANDKENARLAMEFIDLHYGCGVRILISDQLASDPAYGADYRDLDSGEPNPDLEQASSNVCPSCSGTGRRGRADDTYARHYICETCNGGGVIRR